MVGQGVLRECLLDPEVESVLSIVRSHSGQQNAKLREIEKKDFFDFSDIAGDLSGYDACFFCLGVSSAGMSEADYTHLTYDLTMAAAKEIVKHSPNLTFIYVSGAGTDSSERGAIMWARVKGRTENALANLPFKAVYLFRPGVIQPMHGIKSKTKIYQAAYSILAPIFPLWKAIAPKSVTTTELVGRAMLEVAKRGASRKVIGNADINSLGAAIR